jgi:hypothetical protein
MHPKLVPALDYGLLRIFTTLRHLTDVLGVNIRLSTFITPTMDIAKLFKDMTLPAGGMFTDTPEMGADLRIFQRSVSLFQEGVYRLRWLRIAVGSTIPVVDNPIFRGSRHIRFPLGVSDELRYRSVHSHSIVLGGFELIS